jgi:hypothetical protein
MEKSAIKIWGVAAVKSGSTNLWARIEERCQTVVGTFEILG